MIKKIIVATNNAHKLQEIKEVFAPYELEIKSLEEENIVSNPEEDGKDFIENAFIKAESVAKKSNEVILSDDSGLCVHSLNNFPGVYSSRFMEGHEYKEKWIKINEMLKDKEDKTAHFECVICLMNLEKKPLYFIGKTEGIIVENKGNGGFGYDPIFFVKEYNKTFAEISSLEKNSISHRGKALKELLNYLIKNNYISKK